uniref:Uncharacterized protein n=1 Tax=Spodoptera exigua multiple nucleopolyhedrovirus TaxID=10454 RepID=A0A6N0C2J4_9ABAC|nr:hypothetical protein [Spodoptera exigua multiple nucleopolyhedrovirus]
MKHNRTRQRFIPNDINFDDNVSCFVEMTLDD